MVVNGLKSKKLAAERPFFGNLRLRQDPLCFSPCLLDSYDGQVFRQSRLPCRAFSAHQSLNRRPQSAQFGAFEQPAAPEADPKLGLRFGTLGDDEVMEVIYQDHYVVAEVFKKDGQIEICMEDAPKNRTWSLSKQHIDRAIEEAISYLNSPSGELSDGG
jgi:hypothetical protein